MPRCAIFILLILLAGGVACIADPFDAAIARAAALREDGDFKGANELLGRELKSPDLSDARRKKLELQIDLARRVDLDYSLTADELYERLAHVIKDLTRPEFEQWLKQDRFDKKTIGGQTRYLGLSARNIFFQYPELKSRRLNGEDESPRQNLRLEMCHAIKQAALAQKTPYVLQHQFECTMKVIVEKGTVPPGETIRAWLPVPRYYPFQNHFNLIDSSPAVKDLAPATSPIRSAYFEEPAAADGSAVFAITYSYDISGIYFDMDPEKICAPDLPKAEYKKYTSEAPHIVFTDRIKELARKTAGEQTNPLRKARAIYDWIGGNIKYSYSREYSTMTNISDFCLSNGYGDCGMQALLFMTVCRYEGIPARWQTGWNLLPGALSNHDWCEIYLAPYGWVPVDPEAGEAVLLYSSISPGGRAELHDFYFGGLDYYRMAANSDHNQELSPPKQSPRSDDVDFQRGEVEFGRTNIYFDKFKFTFHVKEL